MLLAIILTLTWGLWLPALLLLVWLLGENHLWLLAVPIAYLIWSFVFDFGPRTLKRK